MKNFRKIDQQIYAGSAPNLKDLEYLKNIFGVSAIVSLDQNIANSIRLWCKQNKIKHYIIPLTASETSYSESIKYIVNYFSKLITSNQPVYFHCLHGQDRTGFAEAVYRIQKQNYNFQKALNDIKKFNYGEGISKETQNFYNNILKALSASTTKQVSFAADDDLSNDDIVLTEMRSSFDTSHLDPTGMPRSFSGLYETQQIGPESSEHNIEPVGDRKLMIEKLKSNVLPNVGMNYGLGPARGFGPSQNSAILSLIY